MPKPIPFLRRKPCRACGRLVLLHRNDYICVVAAGGERRYFHRRCLPRSGRALLPDSAA